MVNWNTTLFEIQASLFQMVENSAIKIEIAALDPLILNHLKCNSSQIFLIILPIGGKSFSQMK